jgi:hypothetical protein
MPTTTLEEESMKRFIPQLLVVLGFFGLVLAEVQAFDGAGLTKATIAANTNLSSGSSLYWSKPVRRLGRSTEVTPRLRLASHHSQTARHLAHHSEGDYCRKGRHYYRASSSICRSRAKVYCFDRKRGYRRCPESRLNPPKKVQKASVSQPEEPSAPVQQADGNSESATPTEASTETAASEKAAPSTPEPKKETKPKSAQAKAKPQGDYCKKGRYFHDASSAICRNRDKIYCKGAGGFGLCDKNSQAARVNKESSSRRGRGRHVKLGPANGNLRCNRAINSFQCMMCNCMNEAGNQGYRGKVAVNKVVMTRVGMRSYPNTICGVIWQPSQFSWTLFKKDKNRRVKGAMYRTCRKAVKEASSFRGHFASHYHANYVRPKWRRRCRGRFTIQTHHFYRSCGRQGRARAARQSVAGLFKELGLEYLL